MKLVDSFSKRLKTAMSKRGVRAVDITRETGIDPSKITHYLKGDYEPKQYTLYKLASYLRVSEAWLIGYDVDMDRYEPTLEGTKKEINDMLNQLSNDDLQKISQFIRDYFLYRK